MVKEYIYIKKPVFKISGRNDVGLRGYVMFTFEDALDALERELGSLGFEEFRRDVEERVALDMMLINSQNLYFDYYPFGCNSYGFQISGPVVLFNTINFLNFVAEVANVIRIERNATYEDDEIAPEYFVKMRRAAVKAMGGKS